MNLKKYFIWCAFSLLMFGANHAQVRVGVIGGIHNASYRSILPDSLKFRPGIGLNYGLQFEIGINEDVAIAINPQIINEKTKVNRLNRNTRLFEDSLTVSANYFSIPVQLHILSDNKKFRYIAGLDLAFPQSISSQDPAGVTSEGDESLNSSMLSASFGIGWRKTINRSTLTVDFLYNQGLINLTKKQTEQGWNSEIKTSSLRLNIGWIFDLSRKEEDG